MDNTIKWIKFYQQSLLDGADTYNDKAVIIENPHDDIENLKSLKLSLPELLASKNWEENFDKSDSDEVKQKNTRLLIKIAPLAIADNSMNRRDRQIMKKWLYPFWITAEVDRNGQLYPPNSNIYPVQFIRDNLEPSPKEKNTIANLEKYNLTLQNFCFQDYSIEEDHTDTWNKYWIDCERFFTEVTGKKYRDFGDVRNQLAIRELNQSFVGQILNTYKFIIEEDKANNLLHTILEEKESEVNQEITKSNIEEVYLNANHLGQMGGDYPLSDSQRVALTAYLSKGATNVFAINGPPGTGKTTMLQNIIANHFVDQVLENKPPLLIMASSTNNQAITNILDSMKIKPSSDEKLCKRWINEITSFGLYLTSKNNSNYQCATSYAFNNNLVGDFDNPEYVELMHQGYIKNAQSYLSVDTESKVEKSLRNKVNLLKSKIEDSIKIVRDKVSVAAILQKYGFENSESINVYIDSQNDKAQQYELIRQNILKEYKSMPLWFKWFKKNYRIGRYKAIANSIYELLPDNIDLSDAAGISVAIDNLRTDVLNDIIQKTNIAKQISIIDQSYNSFMSEWNGSYKQKWDKSCSDFFDKPIEIQVAAMLDISYRHELFWYCVHLREIEFLKIMTKFKKESGERKWNTYRAKLQRLSMVTPLLISTFHTLPGFSTYFSDNINVPYKDLYDLLIVDECGQVSPDISVASLYFAKKILAVGDTQQIEPIWSTTIGLDYINAKQYGLCNEFETLLELKDLGFLSSGSSLMQLAKKSSPFKFTYSTGEIEKGTYLLEHRRCLDDIVKFSNEYVYKSCLELKCGNEHKVFPALGYYHLNGVCELKNGSRSNLREANALALWIRDNKQKLEEYHGKGISEIVAIITPFTAQKSLIGKQLRKHELPKDITVGTVHSLQGADRPIVLFSSVYSSSKERLFFDNSYSILNVALTRAKHSFLIFGNMRIFDKNKNTPSGNLAKILLSDEKYCLDVGFAYTIDAEFYTDFSDKQYATTLDEHRRWLKRVFESATREIIICSPFISNIAIKDDSIIDAINRTTSRGVSITIVTDKNLDITTNGTLKPSSKDGRNAILTTEAKLIEFDGMHNKTICIDDNILIEGSFNWLSATRNPRGAYTRQETSVVIKNAGKLIDQIKGNLRL